MKLKIMLSSAKLNEKKLDVEVIGSQFKIVSFIETSLCGTIKRKNLFACAFLKHSSTKA